MCGRYGLVAGGNFYKRYGVKNTLPELKSVYNITPGLLMPVVVNEEGENEALLMKWGLIPFWAKDPSIGLKMINARAESLLEKPAFRNPFERKRCLVPTSGFYEWKKTGSDKVPYFIRLRGQDIFSFAGLYDIWKDAEGRVVKSYTIITTEPNKLISQIHNRMPVVLRHQDESDWIGYGIHNLDKLSLLLKPYDYGDMEAYPVTKEVNNPKNDTPDLIKPYKEEKPQESLF